jgi:hypothetical protein
MNEDLAITITGTRQTSDVDPDDLRELFLRYLLPFNLTTTHWYVGGATGLDTLALDWLRGVAIGKVTVVVPAELKNQPADAHAVIFTALAVRPSFELVELRDSRFPKAPAMHARNHWMVDRSGFVIGFPHRSKRSEGTRLTLEYAEGLGRPRLICPIGKPS